MKKEDLLIGAHTSAQGGVHKAILAGKAIGATTVQLFTSNQKQWNGKRIDEEEIARWREALQATGLRNIMSHDSYLINLGCPNQDNLVKSRTTFQMELERCQQLGITFLNFHPGAALDGSVEQCLDTIVESLKQLAFQCAKGTTRLLLEATAGQGSSVGHRFEHLGYIISRVENLIPIGVCIDTCHIFAAGYDIRTEEGWNQTLVEFEKQVGLKHLYALHVNDSLKALGSRVDRHAPLGKGLIGIESFKAMMRHPKLSTLPKYLETPDPTIWPEEIETLRAFA